MTNEPGGTAPTLRRRAEDKLRADGNTPFTDILSYAKTQRLLHELQVHEVELVMQNDELQLALAEMREHKERLSNIVKYTPAGYFCIDPEGRFIDVNEAWLRMFGYNSPAEVIGKHFSMIQVDSGFDEAHKHLAKLLGGEAIPSGEFSSRRKDGSVGFHTFSAHPVVHADKIVRLEWFIIDISDRVRLEEEKLILQQQIQQNQKLESLGVLAGGIAHDFNNILQIIIGHCYLVRAECESFETCLPHIESSAERATVLCRQMLAYAGQTALTQTQIIMWLLVDEVVHKMQATIRPCVVIKTNFSPNTSPIVADASQIRQAVMSLITNASEAIGKEQGEIYVSLSNVTIKTGKTVKDHFGEIIPAGTYLCLEVTDTGCGMDKETRRRIFEPFYTTKFAGRGLGMSALLGILRAHKGAIQLLSQPEKGSTFKVYLPIQISEPDGDGSLHHAVTPVLWQGSGTILLVEDEEQIRKILKIILNKFGFTVLEAANGRKALELYELNARDIKLVLTDIGMPVMSGHELIHELKLINPDLPIIISSGFGDTVVTTELVMENIAGLITKPYNPDQLQQVLKRVMYGSEPLSNVSDHTCK